MASVETAPEKEKDWETTSIQNLIRYRPSGTYFARFKIGRKLFRKSLETTVLSTARLKLSDKIKEYRLKAASGRWIRGLSTELNLRARIGFSRIFLVMLIGEDSLLEGAGSQPALCDFHVLLVLNQKRESLSKIVLREA